jgi:hypothetical protein
MSITVATVPKRDTAFECPNCGERVSLEQVFQAESALRFMLLIWSKPADYKAALGRYIKLQRSRKRAITWDIRLAVASDVDAIQSEAGCSLAVMRDALNAVWSEKEPAFAQDAHEPFRNHNYLRKVLRTKITEYQQAGCSVKPKSNTPKAKPTPQQSIATPEEVEQAKASLPGLIDKLGKSLSMKDALRSSKSVHPMTIEQKARYEQAIASGNTVEIERIKAERQVSTQDSTPK